jgi:hypothetical protein
MKGILIERDNTDEGVLKLILRKQSNFKAQKNGKCVSLTYTINRMLKEAYKKEIEVINAEKQL